MARNSDPRGMRLIFFAIGAAFLTLVMVSADAPSAAVVAGILVTLALGAMWYFLRQVRCPHCREYIHRNARVCVHCKRDIPKGV